MNKTKCDFCNKESIGYTSYQASIYCEDHENKALEIEDNMWQDIEKHMENINKGEENE